MQGRQKILIVDDRSENLVALRHVLSDVDAELIEATTGNQALAATLDHQFAVAVLDVQMPGMSGYELAEHLRSDEKTKLIPILFLTAHYGDEQEIFRGYEAGAVDYLTKPYSPEILRGKLRIFLELDRNRQELEMHRNHLELLIEERTRELAQKIAQELLIEEELGRQNGLFSSLLKNLHVGVFMVEVPSGKPLVVNDAALHLLGRGILPDASRHNLAEVYKAFKAGSGLPYPPDEMPIVLGMSGVSSYVDDLMVERPDGTKTILEIFGSPVMNDKGEIWASLVSFNDISVRKQTEAELRQKNSEIEQFMYTVSHDLRSPLVTVKTFMGYLEKDLAEDDREQLARDIQFINNAADKMKLLLNELLEFSRIGRVETPPVEVPLSELLDEVLETLAGAIKERGIEIHLPETDMILSGDRPRLYQIWQNLIENAIKYSRDDITPCVDIGMQQENGETLFFVRDNGIGIDTRYLGKVFGIFEKLNPKSSGAGLGLCMVRRIVEKTGGRIWVESEGDGQGSCFRFTLPGAIA